jgi:hypothetical protein
MCEENKIIWHYIILGRNCSLNNAGKKKKKKKKKMKFWLPTTLTLFVNLSVLVLIYCVTGLLQNSDGQWPAKNNKNRVLVVCVHI